VRRPLACLLVCLGPFVVGCHQQPADHSPPPPTEVRHDLEPLTSRFPALGVPEAATWVMWNSSRPDDRGVPGPTTYWIHAVVELAPATADHLEQRYRPQPGSPPEVQDLLTDALPSGPYLTGAALDGAFTTPALAATAYLNPDADVLVVLSTSL
jgi:hypothetical protein